MQEQMLPGAGPTPHPPLTSLPRSEVLALQFGLNSFGLEPNGAWPGWAEPGWTRQGRASQGEAAGGFRCRSPPERELPEFRVTQARPYLGDFSLTALKWPCTPADHTSLPPSPPAGAGIALPSGLQRRGLSVPALDRGSWEYTSRFCQAWP